MAQMNDLLVLGEARFLGNVYPSGQIRGSFKSGEVLNGSYAPSSTTIPNLINEVRYSSGCMGSFQLTTAYTLSSVTLSTAWYNYIWIPHRTGGNNGAANNDNCNYGSLIVCGMTIDAFAVIRYNNGTITSMHKWY